MNAGTAFSTRVRSMGKTTRCNVYSFVCLLAVSSIAGQAMALKPALQGGQEGGGLEWHREGLPPAAVLVEPRMPEVPVFILRLIDDVWGTAGLQGAATFARHAGLQGGRGYNFSPGVWGQYSTRLYDLLRVYRL